MNRRSAMALAALWAAAPPAAIDPRRRGGAGTALARERPAAEDRIGPGWGLLHNDLVLVGPAADPARVLGLRDAAEALRRVAAARAPFVSRGDRGGVHDAELRLWRAAGIDPAQGRGGWYREEGRGAAAALDAAAAQDAYTLAERGAWLASRGRRNLRVLVEDDRRLSR